MPYTQFVAEDQQTVTTSVVRLGGASAWSGVAVHGEMWATVCNNHASNTLYLNVNTADAAIASQVSSTRYILKLGPGETGNIFRPAGADIYAIASASGTTVTLVTTQKVTL